jgi:prepilin-type N-terminal cleavage/methylation domain-containing protein
MTVNHKGFTLIEIIAVLVLTGILATVAGMGIVKVSEGLVFAKQNASTTLKAQVALNRIEKEFHIITGVTAGDAVSFTYTSNKENHLGEGHSLTFSGGFIYLDGDKLIDNVASFTLSYGNDYSSVSATSWGPGKKVIQVTFALTGAGGVNSTFTMRVAPRML